jgi:hypothetical protein
MRWYANPDKRTRRLRVVQALSKRLAGEGEIVKKPQARLDAWADAGCDNLWNGKLR